MAAPPPPPRRLGVALVGGAIAPARPRSAPATALAALRTAASLGGSGSGSAAAETAEPPPAKRPRAEATHAGAAAGVKLPPRASPSLDFIKLTPTARSGHVQSKAHAASQRALVPAAEQALPQYRIVALELLVAALAAVRGSMQRRSAGAAAADAPVVAVAGVKRGREGVPLAAAAVTDAGLAAAAPLAQRDTDIAATIERATHALVSKLLAQQQSVEGGGSGDVSPGPNTKLQHEYTRRVRHIVLAIRSPAHRLGVVSLLQGRAQLKTLLAQILQPPRREVAVQPAPVGAPAVAIAIAKPAAPAAVGGPRTAAARPLSTRGSSSSSSSGSGGGGGGPRLRRSGSGGGDDREWRLGGDSDGDADEARAARRMRDAAKRVAEAVERTASSVVPRRPGGGLSSDSSSQPPPSAYSAVIPDLLDAGDESGVGATIGEGDGSSDSGAGSLAESLTDADAEARLRQFMDMFAGSGWEALSEDDEGGGDGGGAAGAAATDGSLPLLAQEIGTPSAPLLLPDLSAAMLPASLRLPPHALAVDSAVTPESSAEAPVMAAPLPNPAVAAAADEHAMSDEAGGGGGSGGSRGRASPASLHAIPALTALLLMLLAVAIASPTVAAAPAVATMSLSAPSQPVPLTLANVGGLSTVRAIVGLGFVGSLTIDAATDRGGSGSLRTLSVAVAGMITLSCSAATTMVAPPSTASARLPQDRSAIGLDGAASWTAVLDDGTIPAAVTAALGLQLDVSADPPFAAAGTTSAMFEADWSLSLPLAVSAAWSNVSGVWTASIQPPSPAPVVTGRTVALANLPSSTRAMTWTITPLLNLTLQSGTLPQASLAFAVPVTASLQLIASPPACGAFTTCGACTAPRPVGSACGWCFATDTCLETAQAAACPGGWSTDASCDRCTAQRTCSACTLAPGCGWCGGGNTAVGTCVRGTTAGPTSPATCAVNEAWFYLGCPALLSPSPIATGTIVPASPSPAGVCSGPLTCVNCVAVAASPPGAPPPCGWCAQAGTCWPGSASSPVIWVGTCSTVQWRYSAAGNGSAVCGANPCSTFSNCECGVCWPQRPRRRSQRCAACTFAGLDCTNTETCGWCAAGTGLCVDTVLGRPDPAIAACPAATWVWRRSQCPPTQGRATRLLLQQPRAAPETPAYCLARVGDGYYNLSLLAAAAVTVPAPIALTAQAVAPAAPAWFAAGTVMPAAPAVCATCAGCLSTAQGGNGGGEAAPIALSTGGIIGIASSGVIVVAGIAIIALWKYRPKKYGPTRYEMSRRRAEAARMRVQAAQRAAGTATTASRGVELAPIHRPGAMTRASSLGDAVMLQDVGVGEVDDSYLPGAPMPEMAEPSERVRRQVRDDIEDDGDAVLSSPGPVRAQYTPSGLHRVGAALGASARVPAPPTEPTLVASVRRSAAAAEGATGAVTATGGSGMALAQAVARSAAATEGGR